MEHQKETRLRFLAEGGSIKICSIYKGNNQGYDYFVETSEDQPDGEEFPVNIPVIHESFYDAFDELNDKYLWHKLNFDFVDEDFVEYVADALVEKINDSNRPFRGFEKENFEQKLGIHLRTKDVDIKTGVFNITVEGLVKTTQYDYQEFVDSYAAEIGQKFKLDSTAESWDTFNGESFDFVGFIEFSGNSIVLKNSDDDICYVLPADKYKLTSYPLTYSAKKWEYVLTKNH